VPNLSLGGLLLGPCNSIDPLFPVESESAEIFFERELELNMDDRFGRNGKNILEVRSG
jgi:hypothetical protein